MDKSARAEIVGQLIAAQDFGMDAVLRRFFELLADIGAFVQDQARASIERFAEHLENASKRGDGASGNDFGYALRGVFFGALSHDVDVWQLKGLDCRIDKTGFLLDGFSERKSGVGQDKRERNAREPGAGTGIQNPFGFVEMPPWSD